MAAWLQKRLKDAEKLLEQADKTAQRVVVRDPPAALPRVLSSSLGDDPASSTASPDDTTRRGPFGRTSLAQLQEKAPAADPDSSKSQSKSASKLPNLPSSGVGALKIRPPSSVSKPPVFKPANSVTGRFEQNRQRTVSPDPERGGQTQPSTQAASQAGGVATPAQPNVPAIRFMPAAVPTGPQTITAEDDQVSPAALHRPERQPDLDHVSTRGGVANNGRHPAPSKHAGQHVDITPLTMSAQDTDAQPSSPIHVASDNARSDQQMPAEVNTDRTVSIDQQEVEKPAVTPSLEANLQTNASDRSDAVAGLPDSILQQESSISLPKQTAAQVPPSADTAQAPEPLQSPFSTLTQPAQVTSSDNSAVPTTEGEASTSDLQHSADASVTGSQLTQREGSQAQAAAVADAIKKAAQLSLPAPAPDAAVDTAGPGREALLTRLVDQLKGRLQTYKEENQQLEEMLHQSDARASGSLKEVDRLEDALAKAQAQRLSAEAALTHSSTEQQGQVQAAQQALQAATRDLADCQARVADLESTNALLIQESQVSEGRILAALQDEVTAAEARLEEERAAHTNTQRTAAAQEQAVQSSMAEGATALASMQRMVEERTHQATTAQQALMQLQQEQAHLTARLRTAQDQAALRQDVEDNSSGAELRAQLEQLQQERDESAQSLAITQSALADAQAESHQLQQAVHDLQRRKQDRGYEDLQARFNEVTELLYTKQTQLERMAAEKAAQQLAHEREVAHAKDDAERVKRRVRTERAGTTYTSNLDDIVVPMDSLGEAFDRLANDNRVGSYVKAGARALDATASAAVRLIKQYPLGRLFVFLYIVSIHLFIYVLISKMQRSALDHAGHPALTLDDLNSRM